MLRQKHVLNGRWLPSVKWFTTETSQCMKSREIHRNLTWFSHCLGACLYWLVLFVRVCISAQHVIRCVALGYFGIMCSVSECRRVFLDTMLSDLRCQVFEQDCGRVVTNSPHVGSMRFWSNGVLVTLCRFQRTSIFRILQLDLLSSFNHPIFFPSLQEIESGDGDSDSDFEAAWGWQEFSRANPSFQR